MNDTVSKIALVVDDSKSARFALRRFLEARGYRAEAVESAEQAFAWLKRQRPDVIFLDHLMPDVDGFEALRALKKDPRNVGIPVVICSSNEGEEFMRQAKSRGAVDVLPKPPEAEHLARVLERLRPPAPAAPMAAVAPMVRSKVAPIREPGAAVEQALMKAVRNVIESPPAAPAASESDELAALRRQIELLRAQVTALQQQVEDGLAAVRRAALDEAHQVAERAVLSASVKLSEQLTETLLKSIKLR